MGHAVNLPAVRPTLPPILLLTGQPERMDANTHAITHVT